MKNIKYLRKGETEMKELKIRAEFIEELLGSANNDKEFMQNLLQAKHQMLLLEKRRLKPLASMQ